MVTLQKDISSHGKKQLPQSKNLVFIPVYYLLQHTGIFHGQEQMLISSSCICLSLSLQILLSFMLVPQSLTSYFT